VRYRLRTLLILAALLPPLLAGIWFLATFRVVGSATINGSQAVVFRAPFLGGVGISSKGNAVTANFGNQTVFVDAKRVDIQGVRTLPLPDSWSRVELIGSRTGDVRVLVDGTPLEK